MTHQNSLSDPDRLFSLRLLQSSLGGDNEPVNLKNGVQSPVNMVWISRSSDLEKRASSSCVRFLGPLR